MTKTPPVDPTEILSLRQYLTPFLGPIYQARHVAALFAILEELRSAPHLTGRALQRRLFTRRIYLIDSQLYPLLRHLVTGQILAVHPRGPSPRRRPHYSLTDPGRDLAAALEIALSGLWQALVPLYPHPATGVQCGTPPHAYARAPQGYGAPAGPPARGRNAPAPSSRRTMEGGARDLSRRSTP